MMIIIHYRLTRIEHLLSSKMLTNFCATLLNSVNGIQVKKEVEQFHAHRVLICGNFPRTAAECTHHIALCQTSIIGFINKNIRLVGNANCISLLWAYSIRARTFFLFLFVSTSWKKSTFFLKKKIKQLCEQLNQITNFKCPLKVNKNSLIKIRCAYWLSKTQSYFSRRWIPNKTQLAQKPF